jgi:hypothetical protein
VACRAHPRNVGDWPPQYLFAAAGLPLTVGSEAVVSGIAHDLFDHIR